MYYHYTNIDALFGMISSRQAWFSSLAFMNDAMEGYELHKVFEGLAGQSNGSSIRPENLRLVHQAVQSQLRHQLCFSATCLRDDISQWRAYSALGHGVCIGFEDGFFKDRKVEKTDCVYKTCEKIGVLAHELAKAPYKSIDEWLNNPEEFVQFLRDSLPRFKNQSFEPEQETRWIVRYTGLSEAQKSIRFRPHRLGLTLYEPIRIDVSRIKSITLGPQVPPQNRTSLEDFLFVNECANAMLSNSSCTLR